MLKILNVESLSTVRKPIPLAQKIDSAVQDFLKEIDGEVLKLDIVPTYSHGSFGRAIVTVHYESKKGKKKEGENK